VFSYGFIRIFLKGGCHCIHILPFEKNQIAILAFDLERGKVNAIFPCDFCERTDVFIGYFNTLHTLVLGCKLFDGHSAVELPGLFVRLHMLQKLRQGFSQLLLRQLGAVDDKGDNFLFNLFLQGCSTPFFDFAGS